MANTKFARFYYAEEYEGFGECYVLEIYDKEYDDWFLDTAFPLVRREGDESVDKEFVHFSALTKLGHLLDLGYDVNFFEKHIKWL